MHGILLTRRATSSAHGRLSIESAKDRRGVEGRAAFQVQPPDVTNLVHIFTQSTKHPYSVVPEVDRVVESTDKFPCSRPGEGLQIKIADVVEDIIFVACYSPNYKELVFVQHGGMSCSTLWDGPRYCRLRPMGRLEIEDYEVREVRSVLVLATEY